MPIRLLRHPAVPCLLVALAALCLPFGAAAQYLSNVRLTNPIGRTVLELRMGTQLANRRLLFTAAITAGPTGGTTSLLLHQMPIADLFNPGVPAAGWVTVRSSISAFSLGGGCARNNLIDFPYINGSRPEILRITGTTQQVITLGIIGNDQYDSIDCVTQRDGRVLYMLTNRTRQRLELRREQGGLLQLVRDDFGTVLTPFGGGMRPAIARGRRPLGVAPAPDMPDTLAPKGNLSNFPPIVMFFLETIVPNTQVVKLLNMLDDEPLTRIGLYSGASSTSPTAVSKPQESAAAGGVAVGPSRNDKLLWGDYVSCESGGCTQIQPPESFGSAGPFTLFNWAGVSANQVSGNAADGGAGVRIEHTTLVLPNNVIVDEGNVRTTQPSPMAGRGGPVGACPLEGSEIDAGQVLVGVGPTAVQVQHSTLTTNLLESVGRSGFEPSDDSVPLCD